jgi:hypothetical protein
VEQRARGVVVPWVSATGGTGADFTLYDARHTFSSRLLAAGIPLVEIAVWMCHSLRAGGEQLNATTRTYAHATGEFSRAAIRDLEAFYTDGQGAGERRRRALVMFAHAAGFMAVRERIIGCVRPRAGRAERRFSTKTVTKR